MRAVFASLSLLALLAQADRIDPRTAQTTELLLDMVHNGPGDPVGWQQTKYTYASKLAAAGYNGMVTTTEMSFTLAVDYHSLPDAPDFYPVGSPQRAWVEEARNGIKGYIKRCKAAGIQVWIHADMIVFPNLVLDYYGDKVQKGKHVEWNSVSKMLLGAQLNETFELFPEIDGIIVRTGETYVFDIPYHHGNSPMSGSATTEEWIDFLGFLQKVVCEQNSRYLVMRNWDNSFSNSLDAYLNLSAAFPTHPLWYFAVKHTPHDFWRFFPFNSIVGAGRHQQIIEVELQREYEGKGAMPNYVIDGVVNGFEEMTDKIGLAQFASNPLVKGIWTWSRGGGWNGPYIHGHEFWIDMHVNVLLTWWKNRQTFSEVDAFHAFCKSYPGLGIDQDTCDSLRSVGVQACTAVLHIYYDIYHRNAFLSGHPVSGTLMRDHYITDPSSQLKTLTIAGHKESLQWKASGVEIWENISALYTTFADKVQDPELAQWIGTSIRYGLLTARVVETGYRTLNGYMLKEKDLACKGANEFGSATAAYRAFGLFDQQAASLYHFNASFAWPLPPSDGPNGIGEAVAVVSDEFCRHH
eukprot:NODE_122_length_2056_cov_517.766318_g94_i0.p1 GENE.NODE_122_length_2056_cov_517.766318_g94_i0~~NODE_122_length_2056_cov_517.766318_g94_i0.p1  ORF type:complete len:579 (+),score=190.01 NODE_122_length_2056_cov_517.766318_g94_i0:86-1822(+)